MARYRERIVLMIFMLSVALTATGMADGLGGSSYSRYGVGDLRYFSSSRAMGMGGAGTALFSDQAIDRNNPALWSGINRTRFSATALYEGFSSSDFSGSSYLSRTHINGLSLALPVERSLGIVLSAGVAPYSKVNYSMVSPSRQAGLTYTLKYTGEGGLSLAHLGISGSLGEDLHLGTKLDYYFGSISHTTDQTFATTDYTTAEVTRATRYSGAGMTFGAVYSGLNKLFHLEEGATMNIAAVLNTTAYLTTTNERISTFNSGTVLARDTVAFPDGKLRLPFSYMLGLAYQSEKFAVAADYAYQRWNDLTVDGTAPAELRDSYRLGVGVELLPKKESLAPFTQRTSYRAGFFYHSSYYRIKETPINEWGMTVGMGIPVFADSRLGVAAEYSFRGTTDLQLQKDRILRISVTLDIGELWFVRPPED